MGNYIFSICVIYLNIKNKYKENEYFLRFWLFHTLGGKDLMFFIALNPVGVGVLSKLDPIISSWIVEDAMVGRALFNDSLIGLIFTDEGDALCLNKTPIILV